MYSKVIKRLNSEVRMGSLYYFFENILTPISPGIETDCVLEHCIKNGILTKEPQSESYTWKFVPKDVVNFSNRVYVKPFIEIFNAVIKAVQETSSSKFTRVPFIPKDGGESELSDKDDYPEGELCPYVYVENRNAKFKGPIRNRHWYTSGFGFHFRGLEKDEIRVSVFSLRSCHFY